MACERGRSRRADFRAFRGSAARLETREVIVGGTPTGLPALSGFMATMAVYFSVAMPAIRSLISLAASDATSMVWSISRSVWARERNHGCWVA